MLNFDTMLLSGIFIDKSTALRMQKIWSGVICTHHSSPQPGVLASNTDSAWPAIIAVPGILATPLLGFSSISKFPTQPLTTILCKYVTQGSKW